MEHLRWSIILLVIVLMLAFNLDRLGDGPEGDVALHGMFYILTGVAVVVALGVRRRWHGPVWAPVAMAAGVYVIGRLVVRGGGPLFGEEATFVTVTELTLLLSAVTVAVVVTSQLGRIEHTLAALTLGDAGRRVLRQIDDGAVGLELDRARRYGRPLSVLVLRPDPVPRGAEPLWALNDSPTAFVNRLQFAQLARAIAGELRSIDILVEGRGHDNLLIVSPETDSIGLATLADRAAFAARQVGIGVSCGAATFPIDALTLEELLIAAEMRLRRPATSKQPTLAETSDVLVGLDREPSARTSHVVGGIASMPSVAPEITGSDGVSDE